MKFMLVWYPDGSLGDSYGLERRLYWVCSVLGRLWVVLSVLYGTFDSASAAGISLGRCDIRMCGFGNVFFFGIVAEHYHA